MKRLVLRVPIAGALVAALLAIAPAYVATAASSPAGLSVTIRNDNTQVQSGDQVKYTVTVKNAGVVPVDGRLVVTVPGYVSVLAAVGADRSGADASWPITVPAGGTVSKEVTGQLGAIPKGELRVTTLASFYLGDASEPAIRSAEADSIAGVSDPAHAVGERPTTAQPGLWMGWIIGGTAVVIAIIAALVVVVLMRRRSGARAVGS